MATQMQPDLEKFVDDLVKAKNFQDVDDEVLAQIKEDLYDRVEERLNAVIVENLPEEKMEEFDALLEKNDKEGIEKMCQQYIPNMQQLMADALAEFWKTYLNVSE